MCVPDENITKLLEFCYSLPQIQIVKGIDNHEMKFILYLTCYWYFNHFAVKYVYLMYTEYQFTSMKILKQSRSLLSLFYLLFSHFVFNILYICNKLQLYGTVYFQVYVCFYTSTIISSMPMIVVILQKDVQVRITVVRMYRNVSALFDGIDGMINSFI